MRRGVITRVELQSPTELHNVAKSPAHHSITTTFFRRKHQRCEADNTILIRIRTRSLRLTKRGHSSCCMMERKNCKITKHNRLPLISLSLYHQPTGWTFVQYSKFRMLQQRTSQRQCYYYAKTKRTIKSVFNQHVSGTKVSLLLLDNPPPPYRTMYMKHDKYNLPPTQACYRMCIVNCIYSTFSHSFHERFC